MSLQEWIYTRKGMGYVAMSYSAAVKTLESDDVLDSDKNRAILWQAMDENIKYAYKAHGGSDE